MKISKYSLILQAVGMYVMHLPLYILLIVNRASANGVSSGTAKGLLITALVLMAPVFPVAIANIVIAALSLSVGGYDPSKVTMGVKLALIPWYLLNFVIGLGFVGVLANPFLMVAIPVALALLVCSTYVFMLATSLPDVFFFLRKAVKKEWQVEPAMVVGVVFLFIFGLDIIGSVILHKQAEKLSAAERKSE